MRLPLRFIANKLAISYDLEVLNEDPSLKYGTVRLFDAGLSTSTRFAPMVVVPRDVPVEDIPDEYGGIIWLQDNQPATSKPVIWIREDVDALMIMDRVQNIFDMHNTWCDMVRDELLEQKTFADVVPLLSHVTINPFYYADAGFRTLAIKDDDTLYASSSSWRMQSEIGRHPVEVLSKFITSGELAEVNSRRDAWLFDSNTFHTPFISRTIFCQGDVFGHLFIVETYPNQETFDIEVLETFGSLLESHLNLSSLSYSSTGRPYEPMLKNQLTESERNSVETNYLLKLLSWRAEDRYRVVVFRRAQDARTSSDESVIPSEIQAIEDNLSSGKAFLHNGDLVCVVNDTQPESISTENLALHLCERFHWKAAISNLGNSFHDIRSLYKRALETLNLGISEDAVSAVYRYEDYRLAIVFEALENYADGDLLLHDDLRALITHDAENNSELVKTLKVFLDCERNSSKTAEVMFLHRNSISYRLEKIRSLMTSDLDDAENRLFLKLSIYYWISKHPID